MPVAFNTFLPNTAMVAADARTEIDKAYTYLRGGVGAGDVAAGALGRRHVYKLEAHPFPVKGVAGPIQAAFFAGTVDDDVDWRFMRKRVSIRPTCLQRETQDWPIPGLMKTVEIDRQCVLEVHAHLQLIGLEDPDYETYTTLPNPKLGDVVLKVRKTADATDTLKVTTTYDETRRHIHPRANSAYVERNQAVRLGTAINAFAGIYDIYVAYEHPTAQDIQHRQVVVGLRGMTVEVHPQ